MKFEINKLPNDILLGKQTETGVNQIRIDVSAWLEKWPELTISIWAKRPGEAAAYPVKIEMDGMCIVWHVNDADTAIPGAGAAEIMGIADGKKVLSRSVNTHVSKTIIDATTEPPQAAQPWVDGVLTAAQKIENTATHTPVIGENGNWMLWSFDTDSYVDSGVPARGKDGVGIASVEKIGSTGNVDSYRMALTDGSIFDFDIETNAKDMAEAEELRVTAESARAETFAGYQNEIDSLKKDLNELYSSIYETKYVGVAVNEIDGSSYVAAAPTANTVEGYTGIKLASNANYDTYYLVLAEDTEIYFETLESAYVSLCVARDYSGEKTDSYGQIYLIGTDPVRYRKSESNLPTKDSPVSVEKGDAIALTVTKGGTDIVYGLKKVKSIKDSFKAECSL